MAVHYLNLTRGLQCVHAGCCPDDFRFTRIQSTACEQKNWGAILYGAGPDMLMSLASGHEVVVHDRSERKRETRACWMGLSFIRRCCEHLWGLPLTPVDSRGSNSLSMQQHFDKVIPGLSRPSVHYVRYYRQFVQGKVFLRSCYEGR